MALVTQTLAATIRAALGQSQGEPFFNHSTPTVSCKLQAKSLKSLTANTNDQAVNLATLFPAMSSLVAFAIRELDDVTGVSWSPNSTGTRQPIPAGGALFQQTSGSLPTLYFNNENADDASRIEILVWGD